MTNGSGDDSSGMDTSCDDACSKVFGLFCPQFNEAYIKASNPERFDRFGWSVDVYDDTLVVGAPEEDGISRGINGIQEDDTEESKLSGAVYVFVKESGVWTQQAYIKSSNSDSTDMFGKSVAIWGDTLAVGAPLERSSGRGTLSTEGGMPSLNDAVAAGAVYIFVRREGVWTQQDYIKASNTMARDEFGEAVDIYEDTLVVGAPSERGTNEGIDSVDNNENQRQGAVYVYGRIQGFLWFQRAYIKASNAGMSGKSGGLGDLFGSSVSVFEDRIAVGAPREDSSSRGVDAQQNDEKAIDAGAVYLFENRDSGWTQVSYIKSPYTAAGDCFGQQVLLQNDRLLVSAPREAEDTQTTSGNSKSSNVDGAGVVYVYGNDGNTWAVKARLSPSNPSGEDIFGAGLAMFGNLIAVGALNEDGSGRGLNVTERDDSSFGSGAVYLFRLEGDEWSQVGYLKAPNAEDRDLFGGSLAMTEEY